MRNCCRSWRARRWPRARRPTTRACRPQRRDHRAVPAGVRIEMMLESRYGSKPALRADGLAGSFAPSRKGGTDCRLRRRSSVILQFRGFAVFRGASGCWKPGSTYSNSMSTRMHGGWLRFAAFRRKTGPQILTGLNSHLTESSTRCRPDPNAALSQIHMQIMWSRLIAVVEEQAQTLVRTAFSTSVREAGDLSAGVFDRDGNMLAQAVTGTPGHVNSMAARSSIFSTLSRSPRCARATITSPTIRG